MHVAEVADAETDETVEPDAIVENPDFVLDPELVGVEESVVLALCVNVSSLVRHLCQIYARCSEGLRRWRGRQRITSEAAATGITLVKAF